MCRIKYTELQRGLGPCNGRVALPCIWRDIVRDNGAIASPLCKDGLGRVVGSIDVYVGHVAKQDIRPGQS